MGTLRLVVMISGSGSNLQAILDAIAEKRLDAEVVHVISNRRSAFGLQRAENAGVASTVFPLAGYKKRGRSREEYDADLAHLVGGFEPDVVVLAGFMHILSPGFIDRFDNQILNLHPALPGEFPGTHAIERAYELSRSEGLSRTGVMIHWVIPEVDAGPVIATAEVPIFPEDALDDLETRIHTTEHKLLVSAIQSIALETS